MFGRELSTDPKSEAAGSDGALVKLAVDHRRANVAVSMTYFAAARRQYLSTPFLN